ncbi:hypothetical protein JCM19000A_36880 [Silvimonas sp. JCM 19000]
MSMLETVKTWVKHESQHRAAVVQVRTLQGSLRHITLEAESFKSMSGYAPGRAVSVYIDGANLRMARKYSVYRFDVERGRIELLVHLHGRGPGSAWASLLALGDNVWLRGFSGRVTLDVTRHTHWFFGDATTLAPFAAISQAAHGLCEGFIEGDARIAALLEELQLPFTWLDQTASKRSLLPAMARMLDLPAPAAIYVAGAAPTVRAVQDILLFERGLDRACVRPKPFWG